MVESGLLVV